MTHRKPASSSPAKPPAIFITELDNPAYQVGKRLAVKDVFDTRGVRTTRGSMVFSDFVPSATAWAVRALEVGGYANIGKANLSEFAYGATSANPHFGDVPNPKWPELTAGGSSGGSAAAIAADRADLALGTDSGGSIRIPAACCGIVGFKPTWGSVSPSGCFPLAPSFDHAGPLAASVEECIAAMRLLVPGGKWDRKVALSEPVVAVAWVDESDPYVQVGVAAAAGLFPQSKRVDLPLPRGIGAAFMAEVADTHRNIYAEHRELYGVEVAAKIEKCLSVDGSAVAAARLNRGAYRNKVMALFENFDLLATPTLPVLPPKAGTDESIARRQLIRFTFPFNVTGMPAISVPCGSGELPVSIQLVGRPGDDGFLLATARALVNELQSRTRDDEQG